MVKIHNCLFAHCISSSCDIAMVATMSSEEVALFILKTLDQEGTIPSTSNLLFNGQRLDNQIIHGALSSLVGREVNLIYSQLGLNMLKENKKWTPSFHLKINCKLRLST
jgi:hypothetical protein